MIVKVTLREKEISGNRKSLYLDFYPAITNHKTGEPTRREFLGIYIYEKTKSPIDKQQNKSNMELAEQIRLKRFNEVNKPEIYTGAEKEILRIKEQGEKSFLSYFRELAEKKKESNLKSWKATLIYLERYAGNSIRFADLDKHFCNGFRDFLLITKSLRSERSALSINSASAYFHKFKAALNQAYDDGYINSDLGKQVKGIEGEETRREFLTMDEIGSLVRTECENPVLKDAALFSILSGMRFSDIENLKWENVEVLEQENYQLKFTQEKTKGIETLPISKQAFELMGEGKEPQKQVFDGLHYSHHQNRILSRWLGKAGILKTITFHCFRHTYATLQLSHGTDIFTLSKMLGHRKVQTTTIYAKVLDESKREAANRIQLCF